MKNLLSLIKKDLRQILYSAIAFFVAGGVLAAGWFYHESFKIELIQNNLEQMKLIASSEARSIEEFINEHVEQMQSLADNPLFQKQLAEKEILHFNLKEEGYCAVENLQRRNTGDLDSIYVLDNNGIVLHRHPDRGKGNNPDPSVGRNYSQKSGVANVLKNPGTHVSEIIVSRDGYKSITLIEPVYYEKEFVGMVRWLVKSETLYKRFFEPLNKSGSQMVTLLDNEGSLICHPDINKVGENYLNKVLAACIREVCELDNFRQTIERGRPGECSFEDTEYEKTMIAYAPILLKDEKWAVTVSRPESDLAGPIDENMKRTFLASAGLVSILVLLGYGFYRTEKRRVILESNWEFSKQLGKSRFSLNEAQRIAKLGNWEWDLKDTLQWSDQVYRIMGLQVGEIPPDTQSYRRLVLPEDLAAFEESLELAVSGHKVNSDHRIKVNGQIRTIKMETELISRDGEERLIGTIQDITEQKNAMKEIEKEKKFHENIIESLTHPFYVINAKTYEIELANSAAKSTKYKNGIKCYELTHNSDGPCDQSRHLCPLQEVLKTKMPIQCEHIHYENDEPRTVEVYAYPLFDESGNVEKIIEHTIDVTEKNKVIKEKESLKEELKHAEKMEALGTLAGGVAHDLNNILGAIVGYPDLILYDLPEDSPLRSSILAIQQSGKRAAEIVQDLLTLTRRGVQVNETLNLNTIVNQYVNSAEFKNLRAYHPSVQVEKDIDEDLYNLKGSTTHLIKLVMNLVSNAAEAMPQGGRIQIATKNLYLENKEVGGKVLPEGEYCLLSVKDEGVGIPKDIIHKIFQPFYTKKKMGRSGTGLGMAVVWGTVQDHDGHIEILSKENEGTTFNIYFPVSYAKVEKKTSKSINEYMGNQEKILVVDDVEQQRDIAKNFLTRLNYEVETVTSGEEAIEYMKNNSVDLLVLDMVMAAGIDGLDTYKEIIKINPNQKAVIASGFSESDRVKETRKLGAGAYIRKPYTIEIIGLAVKAELEKTSIENLPES